MQRIALAVFVAVFVAACNGGDRAPVVAASIERTAWRLTAPPEARSLKLVVFSGHSSCLTYDHVETEESTDSVDVHAYVSYNGDEACTDDFVLERVQVQLKQPLGNRKLKGCSGADVEWDSFEPSDGCGDIYEF